ncbi:glycosyl transferase [Floricoccus penangensis]|uniref:Glycosyl transferase n=1 Tax=Floricoccus penangensis TaxID=1859475 RepID=A0A9Q5JEJ6_9LACT|nr:glycosyltransferase family 2 protein [Floricoccus penangensis]OFI45909.1 glycosyl transferase [Floricoccus penangensis]
MNNIAVVVTYNKLELLRECIEALESQTIKLNKLVVLDNASTDSTKDYLLSKKSDNFIPIFSEENLGGAGGFNLAIKEAMRYESDNIWIMDDDTIVKNDAHEKLINKAKFLQGDYGFLASNVLWVDNQPCLMNIPAVARKWNSKAINEIIEIKSSSFVSLFVNTKSIKQVGYPIKEFFIWGDDVEYTERISKVYPSYFVADSVAIHKMASNATVDIMIEDKGRVPRYFYDIRNKFYRAKKEGSKAVVKYIFKTHLLILKILFSSTNNKILKIKTIYKGFLSGIYFNPKIEKY